MSRLQISEREVGDITVLTLVGRLVLGEGDDALRECIDALVRDGRINVVLDLHGITYVDSCGIGALVGKYVTLRNRGGHLRLVCPSDRCRHVLALTHLLPVIECYASEDAALRSFQVTEPVPSEVRS
jgi:anti-anti-sigma factor